MFVARIILYLCYQLITKTTFFLGWTGWEH